jgi:hypothetical protein
MEKVNQEMNYKVDLRQTSLLDITFWSNIVVIALPLRSTRSISAARQRAAKRW